MSELIFKLFLLKYFIFIFTFAHAYSFGNNFFIEKPNNNYDSEEDYFGHHHHHHHHEDYNDDDVNDVDQISNTLIQSHIIFRHGNRTPDSFQELYPNDPYLNETYYPYGLGQLTNAGKLREFTVGTSLRKRYQTFLSDMFLSEEVEAISTDFNRTKASLELVLAGLYPPRREQIWNNQLMWQPIPYNFAPRAQDSLLMGILCPKYVEMYQEVLNSIVMQKQFKNFHKIFKYVSSFSGLNVTTYGDIYNLYFGLSTEEEYGLVLPEWTRRVWPESITNIAIREYYVLMAENDMRKMASGYLFKKIVDEAVLKISRTDNKKKIFLYSAHENNIAQLLIFLGVFKPHIPNYGAHVILELHKIKEEFGIKVFYQNWQTQQPELLKIPDCNEFCSFKQFVKLFQKYIPNKNLCGN
ncbi:hypothetical protein ABEB36_006004 [Hypothenemus hampei]|uniref:acid phosphatase n=1 Tax=Hypothenemus hampei TaxID=57062 RepID=A0ABD1F3Z3_HYPHA